MTFREKQYVLLPCKAAGFPQPVITWYKNGHVIGERQQVKAGYLEFKEIQFEDRGMYTCTAENLLGRDQLSVDVTVQGMESNRYLHFFQFGCLHESVGNMEPCRSKSGPFFRSQTCTICPVSPVPCRRKVEPCKFLPRCKNLSGPV